MALEPTGSSVHRVAAAVIACAAWLGAAAPAAAVCVADGAVVVSTSLSQAICNAAPEHVPNASCCSGEASPVWNPITSKCDTTCDSSDPCAYVTCEAQDQCHFVGTCNPVTGVCSNPAKPNNTVCSDGNSCTSGDKCTNGACVIGPLLMGCCGNGYVESGEECDDGNQAGGPDGCAPDCTFDPGWLCSGEPSECCINDDQVRFQLAISQNACESIKGSPDAGCCQGSHKGVWTGSACDIVCSVNKCDPAPGYGTPADYGCFTKPCNTTSPCDPNTGCTHTPVAAGISCGSSATTACTAPDKCNATGTCLPNDAPAGTECSSGEQCNYAECNGTGTCVDASDVVNGEGCDDGDLCTLMDQCQGGDCAPGDPVVCQPFDGCHLAGVCDSQTGFCSAPPAPAGTPCGSTLPLDVECDLPDSCDGGGVCLGNSFPELTPCGPPDGTCFSNKSCADGTCVVQPVQLTPGASCGDNAASDCDQPDNCDELGTCVPNHVTDGTPCGGGTSCFTDGTCADGACAGSTTKPAGTGCGALDSVGDCDAGDTCDDAGHCQRNPLATSHVCRAGAGPCDVAETCDGINPDCPADGFEAEGTPCGALDACTPDQCDAAGTCQPTHVDCPTTTTTVLGNPSTTTTLPPGAQCSTVTGLAHARCLIDFALAHDLCDGETVPPKLDRALRGRLTKTGARLDAAMKSDGRKRARLVKKARATITGVGKKAATARNASKSAKQISPSCASGLGELVSKVQSDLS